MYACTDCLYVRQRDKAVYASLFLLQAQKAVVDVGDILVGSCRAIQVPLVNNSPCPVSFCLSVQQMLLDEDLTYDPGTEPKGIICIWYLDGCDLDLSTCIHCTTYE